MGTSKVSVRLPDYVLDELRMQTDRHRSDLTTEILRALEKALYPVESVFPLSHMQMKERAHLISRIEHHRRIIRELRAEIVMLRGEAA